MEINTFRIKHFGKTIDRKIKNLFYPLKNTLGFKLD